MGVVWCYFSKDTFNIRNRSQQSVRVLTHTQMWARWFHGEPYAHPKAWNPPSQPTGRLLGQSGCESFAIHGICACLKMGAPNSVLMYTNYFRILLTSFNKQSRVSKTHEKWKDEALNSGYPSSREGSRSVLGLPFWAWRCGWAKG